MIWRTGRTQKAGWAPLDKTTQRDGYWRATMACITKWNNSYANHPWLGRPRHASGGAGRRRRAA